MKIDFSFTSSTYNSNSSSSRKKNHSQFEMSFIKLCMCFSLWLWMKNWNWCYPDACEWADMKTMLFYTNEITLFGRNVHEKVSKSHMIVFLFWFWWVLHFEKLNEPVHNHRRCVSNRWWFQSFMFASEKHLFFSIRIIFKQTRATTTIRNHLNDFEWQTIIGIVHLKSFFLVKINVWKFFPPKK